MNEDEHIESRGIIPCPPPINKNFRDLTGRRFGRLTIQAYYGRRPYRNKWRHYYSCVCDCGTIRQIESSTLVSGETSSCGCYRSEFVAKSNTVLRRTHGKEGTPIYTTWNGMIQRCYNPSSPNYKRYGARGITVCERWRLFENFYADMGDPPTGMTLERRGNNLGYSPENCCWATALVQARNRSNNRLITRNGMTMCVTAWEDYFGWPRNVIGHRLMFGWSVERAMTQPPRKRSKTKPKPL